MSCTFINAEWARKPKLYNLKSLKVLYSAFCFRRIYFFEQIFLAVWRNLTDKNFFQTTILGCLDFSWLSGKDELIGTFSKQLSLAVWIFLGCLIYGRRKKEAETVARFHLFVFNNFGFCRMNIRIDYGRRKQEAETGARFHLFYFIISASAERLHIRYKSIINTQLIETLLLG